MVIRTLMEAAGIPVPPPIQRGDSKQNTESLSSASSSSGDSGTSDEDEAVDGEDDDGNEGEALGDELPTPVAAVVEPVLDAKLVHPPEAEKSPAVASGSGAAGSGCEGNSSPRCFA